MRRFLDRLYLGCGALAAVFLVAIAVLILLSVISRLLGIYVPGLSDYAGYAMASSSFLALAYTFGRGGHIRVNVVLQAVHGASRRAVELWCLAAGLFFSAYLAWYSVKMVQVSLQLGDISEGTDATPLWIPQVGMAIGSTVLAIAVADRLIAVARGAEIDRPTRASEAAME